MSTIKGSGGYVLLYRKLLEHPLMQQLPAAWLRVFIAILLRVNWKPGTWWDGTREIIIPAGSMVTSIEKLSKLAGASKRQTRGALGYLDTTHTVTSKTTNRYSILTVVNWETYQNPSEDEGTPDDTPKGTVTTHERHADGAPDDNNRRNNQNQGIKKSPEDTDDQDCPPAFAKTAKAGERHGRLPSSKPSKPKPHPLISEALAQYMTVAGEEKVYPKDRHVVDVVNAAHGASDEEILRVLKYLYNERGLKPGTSSGPRHFTWFRTVVDNYFTELEERRENANPTGFSDWEERNETKAARRADECF